MESGIDGSRSLDLSAVKAADAAHLPESIRSWEDEFREAMMMYSCAIREVKTKLEVLNDELSVRNRRNPIELIKWRVKKPQSIADKLMRRGFPVSLRSMMENLDDVAGVRVICSFMDDIYDVADMIMRQDDLRVIRIKDYIRHPKDNGYRSYHIIVEVPVFFSNQKRYMRVEIQIRTMAMDFWASMDHELKYKKEIEDADEISRELRECAEIISSTDEKMLAIRRRIETQSGKRTSGFIL